MLRNGLGVSLAVLLLLAVAACQSAERCGDGIAQPGEVCLFDRGARIAGLDPCDITVADFDHDGFADIVVPNSLRPNSDSPYTSTFLSGDERSGMRSRVGFKVGELFPTRIARGDFDGDGFEDVVAGGDAAWQANGLYLLPGSPEGLLAGGHFGTFKTVVALDSGDLDGDGASELAVLSELALEVYADPQIDTQPSSETQIANGTALALCPGSGSGDVIHVGTREGTVHSFAAAPSLELESLGVSEIGDHAIVALSCADLRGEGARDLLATRYWDADPYDELAPEFGDVVMIEWTAEGMRRFDALPIGAAATDVAAADFNDDGIDDFAIALVFDDVVALYLSNDEGHEHHESWTTGSTPVSVGIGDLNGDGQLDLAVANQLDDTVELITSDP